MAAPTVSRLEPDIPDHVRARRLAPSLGARVAGD
jgi:hypothetical protein